MKTLLSIAVFITIAIIAWLSVTDKNYSDETLQPADTQPHIEIFINNFKISNIDTRGQANYILSGKRLERYSNSDDAMVSLPVLNFLQENNHWLITADQAIVNNRTNIITLNDNVIMQQQDKPQSVQISSDIMHIDTSSQVAYTDTQVNIRQGPSRMQSTGMRFDNSKNILELNHNVNGYYLNPRHASH